MRYKTVLPILSTAILILSLSPKLLADYSPTSGRWAEAEPYGAAYVDSFNLYQDLRDDPVRYIDPSGLDAQGDAPSPANGPKFMPTSGCGDEPLYNPRLWNDRLGDAQGPIEDSNNCYSYAVNDPYNHPPGKPQPGEQSGNPWYNNPLLPDGSININAIAAGAISDGLKSTDCDKPCPCGQHKVALVYTSSNQRGHRDYHWYRQDSNGYWSSKPGNTAAADYDPDGNKILDPRTANRNYGALNYDKFYGCFCAKTGGIRTGPPNP